MIDQAIWSDLRAHDTFVDQMDIVFQYFVLV